MASQPVTPLRSQQPPPEQHKNSLSTLRVQKETTQEHSEQTAENMNEFYRKVCDESSRYYYVGMNPEEFLDKFLPWNDETPVSYKTKAPGEERTKALLSVPPRKGQIESSMYNPFVSALDEWVSKDEQDCSLGISNPQSLRFMHCRNPDKSCENLNVDVASYWEDELLRDERQDQKESEEDPKYCASFARQQTHEEFKPSVLHDAFTHILDAKLRKGNKRQKVRTCTNVGGDKFPNEGDDADYDRSDDGDKDDESEEVCKEAEEAHEAKPDDEKEKEIVSDLLNDKPLVEDVAEPTAGRFLTNTEHGIHTRGQITAYAGLALSMNFRKHFFSMLIIDRYARFIRWDRRGAVVTYRFDYTKSPKLIFDFYRRYGQLQPIQRGFDPSANPCDLPKNVITAFGRYCDVYGGGEFFPETPVSNETVTDRRRGFCIEVNDPKKEPETFYVPPPRYNRTCLMPFQRGTKRSLACLKGRTDAALQVFFIKDSWQEVSSRAVREAEIYRRLEEAKVQHVASMRLGDDVPNMETESQKWLGERFGKMLCHRLVLETVARSLSTFTWCKVLLSCIADAIEGAQQAYKAGILHRDLSAGNIMIVRDAKTGEWRGILIDWDMCLLWTDSELATRSGRTGTWAFMSAAVQASEGPYVHTLGDDLESAFWVLLYHILLYTRHDLEPHDLSLAFNALFSSYSIRANGGVKGGAGKKSALLWCDTGRSTTGIARFENRTLNLLLNKIGKIFNERYATNDPTIEEPDAEEPTTVLTMDLNDPENMWLATVLRKTVLIMTPAAVTPKALDSPAKNSMPPDDLKMWKKADVSTQDFFAMSRHPDSRASRKTQHNQHKKISQSVLNHLDGLSTKRSYSGEDISMYRPVEKKQRRESLPSSRRSQRLNTSLRSTSQR